MSTSLCPNVKMKWPFRNLSETKPKEPAGFSLIEAVAAVVILGIICSSALIVVNRSVAATADSVLRMHAFELARENMEELLCSDSLTEKVEFGYSDRYPEVEWTTRVEVFNEPINAQMWAKAVCSAEFTDSAGETQKVEFTQWLTKLTDEQVEKYLSFREDANDLSPEPPFTDENLQAEQEPNVVPVLRSPLK